MFRRFRPSLPATTTIIINPKFPLNDLFTPNKCSNAENVLDNPPQNPLLSEPNFAYWVPCWSTALYQLV